MNRPRILLLSVLSALALALALPNELGLTGNPLAGLLCLAPFFMAISLARRNGTAALAGALFMGLAHALSSYWLVFFKEFAVWTIGGSTLGYVGLGALFGLYVSWAVRRPGPMRPFLLAAAWMVWEYCKSIGFLGYPWGMVAYSWTDVLPFIQIADSTGVYGPGLVLAMASGLLSEFLIRRFGFRPEPPKRPRVSRKAGRPPVRRLPALDRPLSFDFPRAGAFIAACFAVLLGYGLVRMAVPIPKAAAIDAVMVQQDGDSWVDDDLVLIQRSQELSRKAIASQPGRPDLVLWSESCLRTPYPLRPRGWTGDPGLTQYNEWGWDYYSKYPFQDSFVDFARGTGTYLFVGSPIVYSVRPFMMGNATVLIGPDAEARGAYAKQHAVPFAEAIPFTDLPFFRDFMAKVVGLPGGGYAMGGDAVVFELPLAGRAPVRFGAPICFEDAFSDVCRGFMLKGADFLINLTNDSWSSQFSSEYQHFVAARFRGVELRTTLVRSTNAGVSAVIGPFGEVEFKMPLFVADSARVAFDVPARTLTPFLALGDWFALALSALLLIAFVRAYLRDERVKEP